MLELRGIRHRYDGRLVLELDRFSVPRGSAIGIVGHNGAGKSTLLRLLALLERPTEGDVWIDDRPVANASRAALRGRVTLVEQRPVLLRGTVRENLGYGLRVRGVSRPDGDRIVDTVARRLDLLPLLDRRRRELSDGETQRVAVARALAIEPDVLLLDEPVSSADRASAQLLYRVIDEERRARGLAVCLATHQLEDAYRWADDIRALAEGRLSPVTPENLFRAELVAGDGGTATATKHARVGPLSIVVMTERTGSVILAIPASEIFVSRQPVASSARNVFSGQVTLLSRTRLGGVHVTADVGIEMVALVTDEAARELGLAPGGPVTFAFKASAVRVF